MKQNKRKQQGFSLVELMAVTVIGLLLSYAIMEIYVTQMQLYKTTNSQNLIQNTENAIANLVTPVIRSAGFVGCSSTSTVISNLNGGGSNPLSSLNTNPTMIMGYSIGTNINIVQTNSANDTNANDWNPALDPTLTGNVQNTSDVVIVLGAVPGSFPAGVTTIDSGSNYLIAQSTSGINLAPGQFAAVSDCVKTSVFQITAVAGTTITHGVSSGSYGNASDTLSMNYQIGSQFIPIQQTAFFVAQGPGGQSALMRAVLANDTWTILPLAPGVEVMKVQYGIGTNGTLSQYVSADAVTNWANVYSVRLGFLIAGQIASGNKNTSHYNVLGTAVTVPADNRLRHVYEITISLRNATS